jgi:two-component system sensor histidine kinase DegS
MMVAGFFISLILGLGTGWFLNRANIEKSKQIELHHLLIEEREKERMQLARNLHDGPIQDLLATMFSMQDLLMDDVAPGVIERLKAIKTSLQAIVSELRTNVTELRSPILSHYGLQKAIQADLENFQQKYPEIKVHYVGITKEVNLPESRLSALFKIYQEAMRNIIRHSAASEISIHYEVSGEALGLSIEDNGSGFMPPDDWLSLAQQGHFGLVGIRERIETIGGQVDIHSHPGKGTGIKITVPHCVNSEKSIEKIL